MNLLVIFYRQTDERRTLTVREKAYKVIKILVK